MKRHKIFIILALGAILFYRPAEAYTLKHRPNVIIIEVDSLRADHMGCYGYYRNTSPNLDKFAKAATLYSNCFAPATWTIPSNYSMLTSLYLRQHNVNVWQGLLDKRIPNIIGVLNSNGYQVGIFGNNLFLLRNLGKNFGPELKAFGRSSKAVSAAIDAVNWAKSQKAPFFLWISFLEPHKPYKAPVRHVKLFLDSPDIKPQLDKVGKYCWAGERRFFLVSEKDGVDSITKIRAKYDGAIHYIDDVIGNLLAGLSGSGLFKNSLIIFISDHGESLGEHGLYFNHVYTCFNEVIKVPLIVKRPAQARGGVVKDNVSLIDVFPTILKETGIENPGKLEGEPLKNNYPEKRWLVSYQSLLNRCLIYDGWKLIQYFEPYELRLAYRKLFFPEYPKKVSQLFNFVQDPAESVNLAGINKDQYAKMKSKMSEYTKNMKTAHYVTKYFEMDYLTKQKLKSLGYLQ